MMIQTLINKKNIVVIFLLLSNLVFSQGLIEVPLHSNQTLISKWEEIKNNKAYYFRPHIGNAINLASTTFLEDFSNTGPFPDTALWMDCSVFINRDYPVAPPTIGVATFDGINSHGYPYNFNVLQTTSAIADTLTSKRILLGGVGYQPQDSLYLSFYYQPQGRGNAPEPADSLILEFREMRLDSIPDTLAHVYYTVPYDTIGGIVFYTTLDSFLVAAHDSLFLKEVWQEMWVKKGSPLPADSSWKRVMVPIIDTAFFKPTFQFRFKNYATISGNGDQWSIDNVYLNHNRYLNDTLSDDVAFVYDLPSLLKNYSAMPYRHFDSTFVRDTVHIIVRNNLNIQKGVDYSYNIYDYTGFPSFPSPVGNDGFDPYETSGYYIYPAGDLSHLSSPMINAGPGDYTFEAVINTSPDINHRNDVISHKQTFWNYFAYDDGTAESAFALNATLLGEIAEQFTTNVADTLRAIDIYFNPLWHDASLYDGAFDLKVWSDAGGHPGGELETRDSLTPWYNQIEFAPDHFKRYFIDPLYMSQPTTFYIGFLQHTALELSVGVDKKTNSQSKIFYTTNGTWYNSPYPGSLMMRPVFGSKAECTGVNTIPTKPISFSVYPNPANDKLYINYNSTNNSDKIMYSVMDVFGRTVLENKFIASEYIDISTLSEGVYFIRLMDGSTVSTTKFIKIK